MPRSIRLVKSHVRAHRAPSRSPSRLLGADGERPGERESLAESNGFDQKTRPLKEYVRNHAKQSAALLPKAPRKRSRNKGWKLYVNASIEAEP